MTAEERHKKFNELAHRLWEIRQELERLEPELSLAVDRRAVKNIVTNLRWANENCTVVGLHQIGQAMNDAMGITKDGKVC